MCSVMFVAHSYFGDSIRGDNSLKVYSSFTQYPKDWLPRTQTAHSCISPSLKGKNKPHTHTLMEYTISKWQVRDLKVIEMGINQSCTFRDVFHDRKDKDNS